MNHLFYVRTCRGYVTQSWNENNTVMWNAHKHCQHVYFTVHSDSFSSYYAFSTVPSSYFYSFIYIILFSSLFFSFAYYNGVNLTCQKVSMLSVSHLFYGLNSLNFAASQSQFVRTSSFVFFLISLTLKILSSLMLSLSFCPISAYSLQECSSRHNIVHGIFPSISILRLACQTL